MKYVAILPVPPVAAEAGLEVNAMAGIQRVKSVRPRTLPPLVLPPRHPIAPRQQISRAGAFGQPQDQRLHVERRSYCRRIEHLPVLLELRANVVRRRHNQRVGDLTEHVDVKV